MLDSHKFHLMDRMQEFLQCGKKCGGNDKLDYEMMLSNGRLFLPACLSVSMFVCCFFFCVINLIDKWKMAVVSISWKQWCYRRAERAPAFVSVWAIWINGSQCIQIAHTSPLPALSNMDTECLGVFGPLITPLVEIDVVCFLNLLLPDRRSTMIKVFFTWCCSIAMTAILASSIWNYFVCLLADDVRFRIFMNM